MEHMTQREYTLRSGSLAFTVSGDASHCRWAAEGTPMQASENADFWRAYLDDGYEREMTVRSSLQRGKVTRKGETLAVEYEKLITDCGKSFEVSLTVTVKACVSTCPGFSFSASVRGCAGVRVNELQLPFVDLFKACDDVRENDVFYHVNGLGWTINDPWERIKKTCHTEYISSDNHVIWNAMRYPGDAAMSWFGLSSGGKFLYMGRHGKELKICVMAVGVSPRGAEKRLMMTVSHFPFAREGETVRTSECFAALCDGGWEKGSDIYGAYARANWYKPPEVPEWVKNITGWQRVILRHQFGEKIFEYKDLPRIYDEGAKCGLNMLMVFGWWKGRFDNGYPVYEPDEGLGGAEELKKAIKAVQEKGGYVALYTNGQLIDVNTDYYRTVGKDVCRIDIDGNDYRDHYRFGNDGLTLRAFGYKSFVTACPANEEWQNMLLEHERIKFEYGCDSAFFDQIGGAAPLPCFNENHFHGPRADECEKWRVEAFRNMYSACPEGKAIGTEMVNDMVLPYVHYIHGIQIGAVYVPGCFPEMFMRTFPEVIQTDRFVHDAKPGTDSSLANAFVHGFRLDVSPWRGRAHIGELPDLAQKIKTLLEIKEKYRRFFYGGAYVYDRPSSIPGCVKSGCFAAGNDRIYTLWNDSQTAQTFELCGSTVTLAAQETRVFEP
jgi:hypothetical protein